MNLIKTTWCSSLILISFIGFSQEDSYSKKHQHFVSTTIMGVRNHWAVGYEYKFVPNDWFKLGVGASVGGFFSKAEWFKTGSELTILSKVFVNFGKKWGWAEIGFTQNTSINFWRIKNSNIRPVTSYYGLNAGPTFTFGKKGRHDVGLSYYYNFTWTGISQNSYYDDQHWFGFIYRFKLK